jgi:hypothetical protein
MTPRYLHPSCSGPPIPARPVFTLLLDDIHSQGGHVILVSSILLIHRIPQRSILPSPKRVSTAHSSRPIHSLSARRGSVGCGFAPGPGLSPGCAQPFVTASCYSPCPQFTSPPVPRENKTNYRPPYLLKEKNKSYLLPT